MVAKREELEVVDSKAMWQVDVEPFVGQHFFGILDARTLCDDVLATPFVDHARAHLTLVALVEHAPNEVAADGAKRGLLERGGHELVAVDLVHFSAHRNPSLVERLRVLLEHFEVIVGP